MTKHEGTNDETGRGAGGAPTVRLVRPVFFVCRSVVVSSLAPNRVDVDHAPRDDDAGHGVNGIPVESDARGRRIPGDGILDAVPAAVVDVEHEAPLLRGGLRALGTVGDIQLPT